MNIIVDTLGAWDKQQLINKLAQHDLIPDDINFVVCTHSHPDHVGNLNVFTKCKHIVGNHVYECDRYHFDAFDDNNCINISKDVTVIKTPGHTLDDVSVFVKNVHQMGDVVIAGDLFECKEDLNDDSIWKDAGSQDPHLQQQNRQRVLQMADYIIPGHGPIFALKDIQL